MINYCNYKVQFYFLKQNFFNLKEVGLLNKIMKEVGLLNEIMK